VVEGAMMLAPGDVVTITDLPEEIASSITGSEPRRPAPTESAAVADLSAVERDAISTAIARRHGNLTQVAQDLGISKSTLYLKIRKYGLDKLLLEVRLHGR
jgi:sigma-54 dependent transcriptional regulator, acetoin dehydrogenase operon transcriptional activator AcoR